jgi:glycosyltransferase involved in cell wall biosynthesis
MHHKCDILFILKKNETYGFKTMTKRSSGLWNSTRFIVESLLNRNIRAEIVEVIDNNCIDRVVTQARPKIVIIEALWVVPEKFDVLKRLHPNVSWYVHMHSGLAFLAQEGIATEWLKAYSHRHIGIIANSLETYNAFRIFTNEDHLDLLYNVYIPHGMTAPKRFDDQCNVIDVGCFGAVRPLKNQLIQALAAIDYAVENDFFLCFHINGTRKEVGGEPVYKNIKKLFDGLRFAELIEHPWYEPEDFHSLLRGMIDISLQVSLSETFNVVTADALTCGVPVVVSDQVSWTSKYSQADTDSILDITKKMAKALAKPCLTKVNQGKLIDFSNDAQDMWASFVRRHV